MRAAARLKHIDAMRGLALLGILFVNVWSMTRGEEGPRYGYFLQAGEWGGQLAMLFTAWLVDGKCYPIFAFLFGAGFALQMRSAGRDSMARRMRWLLVCGLLHAALLWYGDILHSYALLGIWSLSLWKPRLHQLFKRLRWVLAINLVLALVMLGAFFSDAPIEIKGIVKDIIASEHGHSTYTGGSLWEQAFQRWKAVATVFSLEVFFLPRLALWVMLGMFAVRLGYLTRPDRHQRFWHTLALWGLGLGLPLNGLIAWAEWCSISAPFSKEGSAVLLGELAGPLLAAGYIGAILRLAPRWPEPLGRMALTNYLCQTLIGIGLFQWCGLGQVLPRGALPLVCLAIAIGQLFFSRWWLARHPMGPMEAIWRRHTYRNGRIEG